MKEKDKPTSLEEMMNNLIPLRELGVYMNEKDKPTRLEEMMNNLIPLREFCRKNKWPRLPQWEQWINESKPIAQMCVKKIGGLYLVDLKAFEKYIEDSDLFGREDE